MIQTCYYDWKVTLHLEDGGKIRFKRVCAPSSQHAIRCAMRAFFQRGLYRRHENREFTRIRCKKLERNMNHREWPHPNVDGTILGRKKEEE